VVLKDLKVQTAKIISEYKLPIDIFENIAKLSLSEMGKNEYFWVILN
jgi:hypothetical protein